MRLQQRDDLSFTIVNFLFWMVTFLWPHNMKFTFPI